MADDKKSALLQAAAKLKNAKKTAGTQSGATKAAKPSNAKGNALKQNIKDAVSKFEGN